MRHRIRWLALVVAVLIVLSGAASFALTPDPADLPQRVAAYVAAHHGVLLRPGDVPPTLAEAVVVTEDERFYSHHGVDVVGLARALLDDATHRCLCQGGSTITEQLAKGVYLGGSDQGLHKIEDIVLALKIETRFNKQQILADYLSEIPTGPGLVGVSAAACRYFGQRLDHLDPAQYALLAGLTQAPSAYDPLVDPSLARARRHEVLAAMLGEGYITAEKMATADAEKIVPASVGSGC